MGSACGAEHLLRRRTCDLVIPHIIDPARLRIGWRIQRSLCQAATTVAGD